MDEHDGKTSHVTPYAHRQAALAGSTAVEQRLTIAALDAVALAAQHHVNDLVMFPSRAEKSRAILQDALINLHRIWDAHAREIEALPGGPPCPGCP